MNLHDGTIKWLDGQDNRGLGEMSAVHVACVWQWGTCRYRQAQALKADGTAVVENEGRLARCQHGAKGAGTVP